MLDPHILIMVVFLFLTAGVGALFLLLDLLAGWWALYLICATKQGASRRSPLRPR